MMNQCGKMDFFTLLSASNEIWKCQKSEWSSVCLCLEITAHWASALTDPEKEHHAEHGQQGGDHHTEEGGQLLRLPVLGRPPPLAARVLLRGLAERRWALLGFIDAVGEAVVEERRPLCHDESSAKAFIKSLEKSVSKLSLQLHSIPDSNTLGVQLITQKMFSSLSKRDSWQATRPDKLKLKPTKTHSKVGIKNNYFHHQQK